MSDAMAEAAATSAPASTPVPALSPAPTVAYRRAQAQAAAASSPKSWGESLQRYAAAHVTPAPEVAAPRTVPSKAGQFNKTIQPAQFDPLIGVYTSAERESAVRASEDGRALAARLSASRKRDHMPHALGYNIVNNVPSPSMSNPRVVARLKAEDRSHPTRIVPAEPSTGAAKEIHFHIPSNHPPVRDWNVITNEPRFEGSRERMAAADFRPKPAHCRSEIEAREFNIVSNRYEDIVVPVEEKEAGDAGGGGSDASASPSKPGRTKVLTHEDRMLAENRALESRLRATYYAQSHYNPVTLQFVHPEEEARFQDERARASASHGQLKLAAQPPSFKRSEGALYDIVAPERIKDGRQLEAFYEVAERNHRAAHQAQYRAERRAAELDRQAQHTQAVRSVARVSTKRYEEQLKRGFDPLTNQPPTRPLAPNALCQPAIGWARLEAQAGGRPPAGKKGP